ncbi:hypothetical protein ACVWXU_007717 [Streptomyces sp. TE33382]
MVPGPAARPAARPAGGRAGRPSWSAGQCPVARLLGLLWLLRPATGQPVALARAPASGPAVLAAVDRFLAAAAGHRLQEDRWGTAPGRPCATAPAAPAARGIGEGLRFHRDAAEHACPGRQGKPVPLDQPVPPGDLQFACLRAGALVGALRVRRRGAFAGGAIAEALPVSGVLLAGTTFDAGHSAAGRGTEPATFDGKGQVKGCKGKFFEHTDRCPHHVPHVPAHRMIYLRWHKRALIILQWQSISDHWHRSPAVLSQRRFTGLTEG